MSPEVRIHVNTVLNHLQIVAGRMEQQNAAMKNLVAAVQDLTRVLGETSPAIEIVMPNGPLL